MKSFNHFGVYGICQRDGKLEANEPLIEGLVRELMEETGYAVKVERNLGTFDFFVRYQEDNFTHMHHLAALYHVELDGEQVSAAIPAFAEQDSGGMEWVEPAGITLDSASPVAVLAVKWLNGEALPLMPEYLDNWEMKQLQD